LIRIAGIGFELRKLYKEEGLIHHVRAYSFSSMTTVGPMILCVFLVASIQRMMVFFGSNYIDWEIYITTVTYCFIFSIILSCGLSMVLTRFIADLMFQKKYKQILSSFYGAMIVLLPICGIVCLLFLLGVSGSTGYKIATYLFFMELVILWIQGIYLSALKDYQRIVRNFAVGVIVSLISAWWLFRFLEMEATTTALVGIDTGFTVIVALNMLHFEQMFPRNEQKDYFAFLSYFKKYPSAFFSGFFVYSGIYIHNFIYWFGNQGMVVADRFRVMPLYDFPVFYAYLSVVPSLVIFVVTVETSFYEKFRIYYSNVVDGGTYKRMNDAKQEMQKALLRGISFLVEVQLLFTVLSIALGLKLLPKIGFTMEQLDMFVLLALGFFFFILMFVLLHALMYFDDRKGVLIISGLFFVSNGFLTYLTMMLEFNGLGMFIASFCVLAIALFRLLYILQNIDYYTFCSQPLFPETKQKRGRPALKTPILFLSLVITASLLLAACTKEAAVSEEITEGEIVVDVADTGELVEDKRLYERDVDKSIKSLYITVLPDKSGEKDPVSWYELNRITDRYSEENLDIIMSEGTEDLMGPKQGMFGFGSDANAKISLRGNTARYAAQKSYKIKLFDDAGLWQNQRTINLNKHIEDPTRLRNKLSFDLMERIPNMTSLRTQFVHLYVKDLSEGSSKDQYVDYGLYTHVEQPNEMFLKNHWLDPNGYLYKVTFFEFQRYPDQIKSHTDPEFDKQSFESILEIKGREEHDKLIAMLDDLNNLEIPIEEVMDKYFDIDNVLAWTAVNILTDNMDTDANNFYLYSPLNSEKWYILPWDYDGGWELQRTNKSIRPYQAGISNFWGSTLHNRFFRSEEHVQMLKEKIEEISQVINKETVENQLALYTDIVKPFLFRAPDQDFLTEINTHHEDKLQQLIDTPERAIQRFEEDLEKPKPFYMNEDVSDDGVNLHFTWQIAFDLQGDELLYDFTVAKDPSFTQVVETKKNLPLNEVEMKKPAKGIYYWKVTVHDSKGNEQVSFDMHEDSEGNNYFGVLPFEVN